MVKCMDRVSCFIVMEILMKVFLLMDKLKSLEYGGTLMVINMKGI